MFWKSAGLQFVISIVGVIVFTGLTAWDAQKLKAMAVAVPEGQVRLLRRRRGAFAVPRLHQPVPLHAAFPGRPPRLIHRSSRPGKRAGVIPPFFRIPAYCLLLTARRLNSRRPAASAPPPPNRRPAPLPPSRPPRPAWPRRDSGTGSPPARTGACRGRRTGRRGRAAPRGARARRSGRPRRRGSVGAPDRREPVGDDEGRPPLHQLGEALLDERLALAVERGGGLVQDQDPRIGEDRARDRDPLALAAGELHAPLADDRVVASAAASRRTRRSGRSRRPAGPPRAAPPAASKRCSRRRVPSKRKLSWKTTPIWPR